MADLFKTQDRCDELFRLWEAPSESLKPIFKRHRDDVLALLTRAAKENEDWVLLERLCVETIDEKLADSSDTGDDRSKISELCARRSDLWGSLISAANATLSGKE
jgi:hypothetical protein